MMLFSLFLLIRSLMEILFSCGLQAHVCIIVPNSKTVGLHTRERTCAGAPKIFEILIRATKTISEKAL